MKMSEEELKITYQTAAQIADAVSEPVGTVIRQIQAALVKFRSPLKPYEVDVTVGGKLVGEKGITLFCYTDDHFAMKNVQPHGVSTEINLSCAAPYRKSAMEHAIYAVSSDLSQCGKFNVLELVEEQV